jgi:hypothetical protein
MKSQSPRRNLSRVSMLDLSDALAAGRLKTPYSALRITEYVPEPVSDEIGADSARMAAAGMQPAHITIQPGRMVVLVADMLSTGGITHLGNSLQRPFRAARFWSGCFQD